MKRLRRMAWIASSVAVLLVVLAFLLKPVYRPSPQDALRRFMDTNTQAAEDELMDPLILAGDRVVPLVIEKVGDRRMPHRRYAIAFLGNAGRREALPILKAILEDKTEAEEYRGDALGAVAGIDLTSAIDLARKYECDDSFLGDVARQVIAKDPELFRKRTYLDALMRKHE